jgi:ribosome-associated toxin RatA of RatAB toxin-antitoxin module
MAKAVTQINQDRALIFSCLTDFASYPTWFPGCEGCKVQSSEGTIWTIEIVLNSMKRVNLVLRYDAAPDQLLKFEMVSGELKGYTGSYKLMNATEGSGTVVSTELEMDAGPMAPRFIVDRLVKKIVESTNDAIGKRAAAMAAKQPVAATTEVRATSPVASKKKKFRQSKCVLRVFRSESGEQIWFRGKIFQPK